MTRSFVPDASVAVGWVHPAQATIETAGMLDAIAEDHDMAALAFTALAALAFAQNLSVSDAAYLELAQRRKLPLGCKDGPLRAAASGVACACGRELPTFCGLTDLATRPRTSPLVQVERLVPRK